MPRVNLHNAPAKSCHAVEHNRWQAINTWQVDSTPVQQSEVDLLKHLLKLALHHDDTLSIASLPDVHQVIDAGAPLVDQEGRRLQVCRLDPVGKQVALVSLVPQVLIQVGVCDLLQGLNLIYRDEVTVQVHELNGNLQATSTMTMLSTLETLPTCWTCLRHCVFMMCFMSQN